jgi:NADPH2:quinone reductase
MFNHTMRAVEINAQALKMAVRPIPRPKDHQVLINVIAAGVNRSDILQRKGLYPAPPDASDIPGLEVSGIVVELGANNLNLKIGDKVCALVTGGGYAEYCLASANLCLPIPEGFSFIQAAALPETFFTVWSTVFDRAKLLPNETLLIHGGCSGIGTTAIQLAKYFGAKVIVTSGSETKCDFCLTLGADAAINYQQHDFVEEIQKLTHNTGVDVILDIMGGDYLPRNLKCMATDGRLIQIALQNGAKAEINLLPILLKRLTLTGSTLRARDDQFKADIAQKLNQLIWPLLESGAVKPIIHSTFALTEAAKAHALMESFQHIGKIILEI